MEPKAHWEAIYQSKAPGEVSWYQPHARQSLALIQQAAPGHGAAILDVGGGASTLADDLLSAGYSNVTVLDLSGSALAASRARLGPLADGIHWLEADVRQVRLPEAGIHLWHDRAVFHFLTRVDDRQRYVQQVRHGLRPGGHVVIATFAEDGPSRCSGLAVQRYSPDALLSVFGRDFQCLRTRREIHLTPAGREQAFIYCLLRMNSQQQGTRNASCLP